MFNIYRETAPKYLNDHFNVLSTGHNTRNTAAAYVVPNVKGFGLNNFLYTGIKQLHSLPVEIRTIETKSSFKKAVKKFLNREAAFAAESQFSVLLG